MWPSISAFTESTLKATVEPILQVRVQTPDTRTAASSADACLDMSADMRNPRG